MRYFTTLTTFLTFVVCLGGAGAVPAGGAIGAIEARAPSSTSKAGLGWGGGDDDLSQFTSTGKVSWYYEWSPNPAGLNLEFVPMLWGQRQVDQFSSSINGTISSQHVTSVLGMNEPQEAGQSNLTPDQGAQMWKTYLEPLKAQGVRLGSPAPSSNPNGMTWLQNFMTSCAGGCTVDFIALHYYDVNATDFQRYLTSFHDAFQKPIWVTEWACQNYNDVNAQCSQEDVNLFLNQTQAFMDSTDWVERYAWFGAMENLQGVNTDNALMDKSGKITALGKQYIGAQGANDGGGVSVSGAHSLTVAIRALWAAVPVLLYVLA